MASPTSDVCPFTGIKIAEITNALNPGEKRLETQILPSPILLDEELLTLLPNQPEHQRQAFRRWIAEQLDSGNLPSVLTKTIFEAHTGHSRWSIEQSAHHLLRWMVAERRGKPPKEFDFSDKTRIVKSHPACLVTESESREKLIPLLQILQKDGSVVFLDKHRKESPDPTYIVKVTDFGAAAANRNSYNPASASYRRVIVTEIRLRGSPSVRLRIATIPRIRNSNRPIDVRLLLQELNWNEAIVLDEKDVILNSTRTFFRRNIDTITIDAGISESDSISDLIRECWNEQSLILHVNPHVTQSIEQIVSLAEKFIENPGKPARAILIIGGAVVLITICLFGAAPLGRAIGEGLGNRAKLWFLTSEQADEPIERVERFFEREVGRQDLDEMMI